MFKKVIQMTAVILTTVTMIFANAESKPVEVGETVVKTEEINSPPPIQAAKYIEVKSIVRQSKGKMVEKPEIKMAKSDIELIALVTMAEAEGESEKGKRLVISTILNRLDSEHFPDTVKEVIYQPGQFTSMWNGRSDRCYVKEDICQLVREELESRTNSEVIFFGAGDYSAYGSPMFQEGDHYFSSYT